MRDGGVTGDDKKYSNIWELQKAAMRGKEALLTAKNTWKAYFPQKEYQSKDSDGVPVAALREFLFVFH